MPLVNVGSNHVEGGLKLLEFKHDVCLELFIGVFLAIYIVINHMQRFIPNELRSGSQLHRPFTS